VENTLEDERHYYAFSDIERLRELLLKDTTKIKVTDLGAGSHRLKKEETRSIAAICKTAVSPPKKCQLLFKIVHQVKPKTILEIGTSLGISTIYQAKAASNAQLISLEGSPAIAQVAQQNLKRLKVNNTTITTGPFEATLVPALQQLKKLDYVFIDGNHRQDATLLYFEKCLDFAHADSVFVIDDIYWSAEMQAAWQSICQHPKVTLSVDYFDVGLVFFRKDHLEKEHHLVIRSFWKPWARGFF